MAPAKRAALYVRISDDRRGDELGVTRQKKECTDLADRLGLEVVAVYEDNDVSASRYGKKPRPGFDSMLAASRRGEFDAVVTWVSDRLYRRPVDLETTIVPWVEETGVEIHSVRSGRIDLTTASGIAAARMFGAMAAYESDIKSERIKARHRQLREAGQLSGGWTRPFGYRDDFVTVDEDEAAVVRDLVARVLAGESIRSLCNDLDARRITTTRGNRWHPTTVRDMLSSARIAGMREDPDTGEMFDAMWDGIITVDDLVKVRALFRDPARKRQGMARSYLLTGGLLVCADCKEPLVARPTERGKRRYVCAKPPSGRGCGRRTVVADDVERLITDGVVAFMDKPGLARTVARHRKSSTRPRAESPAAIRADLDQLADDHYVTKLIGRSEFLRAHKGLSARLEAAEAAAASTDGLDAVEPWLGRGAVLAEQWDDLPLSTRRAIVSAVLVNCEVAPVITPGRSTFDPARIVPTWRASK